jgi:CubicO group peptidase (beta-lactamase class C family)
MRVLLVSLAAAASFIFVSTARSEDSLDTVLAKVRAQYALPALAAAVVKNGNLVAAGAVGSRVAGRDMPVTTDDRFHLGSDTKAMTATLAAMMIEEGKLRWNSTIGDVLGSDLKNLKPKFAAITLAHERHPVRQRRNRQTLFQSRCLRSHADGLAASHDRSLGVQA